MLDQLCQHLHDVLPKCFKARFCIPQGSTTQGFRPQYDSQRWCGGEEGAKRLHAWQRGVTGYPLVDAAMRQLWLTGWM